MGSLVEIHVTGQPLEVAARIMEYLDQFPPLSYGTWEVSRYPAQGGKVHALLSRCRFVPG